MSGIFKPLTADEIEVRTGSVSRNDDWFTLLLYKDARVDQNRLDDVFGVFGWQRTHEIINGELYCTISVKDETGNWISKQDVGVPPKQGDAVKGCASDSFKRAGFLWGIGRELYTAPKITVKTNDARKKATYKYHVSSISYNDKTEINGVEISDAFGNVVFSTGDTEKVRYIPKKYDEQLATDAQKNMLKTLCNEKGLNIFSIMSRTGWEKGKMLTAEQYGECLRIINEQNAV